MDIDFHKKNCVMCYAKIEQQPLRKILVNEPCDSNSKDLAGQAFFDIPVSHDRMS